jgi:hypothetical protein
MNFSLIEQRVVLAMLLRKYTVRLPPGREDAELSFRAGRVHIPENLSLVFDPLP